MKEYTIKQAAEILEVSTSTVRRRIKSKEIKAEKKESPYGKQYFIPGSELDRAVMEKDSIEIGQVSKPIDKEEFLNSVLEVTESNLKNLFQGLENNIAAKIESQNQQIEEYKQQLKRQNELIKDMKTELKEIKQQNNKTFLDKVKNIFK